MAAHLADRRRVLELLDFRRRIQRRAPPAAFGATTVLLHGHSRHTAGPASQRHQGLTTHGALPQTRTSAVHSALTRPQCPKGANMADDAAAPPGELSEPN